MSSVGRRTLALVALCAASVALLATQPSTYEPAINARLAQDIELTAEQPSGTAVVRLTANEEAMSLRATDRSRVDIIVGGIVGPGEAAPEFRVVGVARVGDEDVQTDEDRPESPGWRFDDVCRYASACSVELEITVEWLNPVAGETREVDVTVEAGVEYTEGGISLDGEAYMPDGAAINVEAIEN